MRPSVTHLSHSLDYVHQNRVPGHSCTATPPGYRCTAGHDGERETCPLGHHVVPVTGAFWKPQTWTTAPGTAARYGDSRVGTGSGANWIGVSAAPEPELTVAADAVRRIDRKSASPSSVCTPMPGAA